MNVDLPLHGECGDCDVIVSHLGDALTVGDWESAAEYLYDLDAHFAHFRPVDHD